MINSLLEKIGVFFDNLSIPSEIVKVFNGITDIWNALPFVLRTCLLFCFGIACMFAILKMIF